MLSLDLELSSTICNLSGIINSCLHWTDIKLHVLSSQHEPEKVKENQETSWVGNAFFSLAGSLLLGSGPLSARRFHCSTLLCIAALEATLITKSWVHWSLLSAGWGLSVITGLFSRMKGSLWWVLATHTRVMCPDNGPWWSPHYHGQPGAGPGHEARGVRQHQENNSIFSPRGLHFTPNSGSGLRKVQRGQHRYWFLSLHWEQRKYWELVFWSQPQLLIMIIHARRV